jgi:hypothetical protein
VPDRGGKGKLELLMQTFKGVAARAFAGGDRIRPRLREGRILQANAVASSFRRPGRSGGRARRADDVSRDHPWAVDRDVVPPPPRLPTSAIRTTCSVRPYPRGVEPRRRRGAPVRSSPPACNASRRRGRRSRVGCGPRRRHGTHCHGDRGGLPRPSRRARRSRRRSPSHPHLIAGRGSASADVGDNASLRERPRQSHQSQSPRARCVRSDGAHDADSAGS